MTATVGAKLDRPAPESSAVTFILADDRLITNRYARSDAAPAVHRPWSRGHPAACTSSATLLAGLLEAFTERTADLLERVQLDLDSVSLMIFPRTDGAAPPAGTCAA